MSDGNSLINLGDLSKPATVLVEKVSGAIGVWYEPKRIEKAIIAQAKGEAEAAKIKALAEIEVTEIQQRALNRLIYEEGKRQENIESITADAITKLNDDSKPEEMDDDWISHVFEKCRNVSDREMQSLWSSILAGEANVPDSFSKRTIDIVSSLDKYEAELFTQLCSFAIEFGTIIQPLVFDYKENIYSEKHISFTSLDHLESIGLIKFNIEPMYALKNLPPKTTLHYFDYLININLPKPHNGNKIQSGHVLLTLAGRQLAPICGAEFDENFLSYLTEHYEKQGYGVSITYPENDVD